MALKLTVLCLCVCGVYNLKLEKALIFSRHNIREPVTDENLKELVDIWPASTYVGQLTPKGANLEKHMGEYIGNWLKKNELVSNCPNEDSVYVYANTLQRTRETAKAFVDGAFPNCDVKVNSIDPDQMDPVFNTSYRNTPPQTKDLIAKEMKNNLNKLDLKCAYVELDKLVDISDASICREYRICSFANSSDKVFYEIGKEPELIGPLKYGNEIVDAYLMAYYEGFAMESVDDFENLERLLGEISRAGINVYSHSPYLARLAAKILLDYIFDALVSDTKLVLMVGHDSNIQSLVDALDIEEFTLPNQIEKTPIGGKLIFQKWRHQSGEILAKISFVYQTTKQLREGVLASEEYPPRWINLKMSACPADLNGLMSWKCFLSYLNKLNLSDYDRVFISRSFSPLSRPLDEQFY